MLQIVGVGSLEPPKGEGGGEEWFLCVCVWGGGGLSAIGRPSTYCWS
ncbi:unnamed protein product, partial [Vitis vinifera]